MLWAGTFGPEPIMEGLVSALKNNNFNAIAVGKRTTITTYPTKPFIKN